MTAKETEMVLLEDLRSRLDEVRANCDKQMRAHGSVLHQVVAWDEYNAEHVVALPYNSEEEKHFAINMLRQFFVWKQICAYVMVAEAWTVTRTREQLEAGEYRRPAECDDRQEVVLITCVARDGQVLAKCPIERDENGSWLGDVQVESDQYDVQGVMANMLPPLGAVVDPVMEKYLEITFKNMTPPTTH